MNLNLCLFFGVCELTVEKSLTNIRKRKYLFACLFVKALKLDSSSPGIIEVCTISETIISLMSIVLSLIGSSCISNKR